MSQLQQTPSPGLHLLRHVGDIIEFRLHLPTAIEGEAWLRCNLGRAGIRQREIIDYIETGQPILEHDWHDLAMRRLDPTTFSIRLPLLEPGRFQAKAFLASSHHRRQIRWPAGSNTLIKVEAAEQVAANSIYNAFVRQFSRELPTVPPVTGRTIARLDRAGYTVIPPSGTFRELIRRLDLIMDRMNFRILQLLPVHPVPTTYARMGRFGSPFAALNLMEVDPSLAEFDRQTTPLDQFHELVEAVHSRSGRLFLDLPLNHTGWASSLQVHHPEWFTRDQDRHFKSPGAWGVTWEDLAELDYRHPSLWRQIADVLLFWCRLGVDGFRCDAGYMLPFQAWQYLVAKVREQYPETTFFLEGLGGKIETTRQLLDQANLDWAYSEIFQNHDRSQLEQFFPEFTGINTSHGLLVNFAETHDNNRLAAVSRRHARLRVILTALASVKGGFGIANGVEWFATEKIDVHGSPSLNWGSRANLTSLIGRINRLLASHPAFFTGVVPRLVHSGGGNAVAWLRKTDRPEDNLLILANLDWRQAQELQWPIGILATSRAGEDKFHDWLGNRTWQFKQAGGEWRTELKPGQALCLGLAADRHSPRINSSVTASPRLAGPQTCPQRVEEQLLNEQILKIHNFFHGLADLADFIPARFHRSFREHPGECCRQLAGRQYLPLMQWQWPRDLQRMVVIPSNHLLWIRAEARFTAELRTPLKTLTGRCRSLCLKDGSHSLIIPVSAPNEQTESNPAEPRQLVLEVYNGRQPGRGRGHLQVIRPSRRKLPVSHFFDRPTIKSEPRYAICANPCGTMAQVQGGWAEINSQYDALLAANLHPDYPVDRRVLFTRCRGWVVNRGYSRQLDHQSLRRFGQAADGTVHWEFEVPTGLGQTIGLTVQLELNPDRNRVELKFTRLTTGHGQPDRLPDSDGVEIILRPDLEDRSSHEKTKAFTGPEQTWPNAVSAGSDHVIFSPGHEHRLHLKMAGTHFEFEPEWQYMVEHPLERERGLEDCSDLFSPGWFKGQLKGGQLLTLEVEGLGSDQNPVATEITTETIETPAAKSDYTLAATLRRALRKFIVKRQGSSTVLAGFPWFLDWGRDTLITLRGIIADRQLTVAADILGQFAKFENRGTLPNMIRGNDDSNRNTSDAPLWFFTACRDLLQASGENSFIETAVDSGRTIRQVLDSIAENYLQGTANGICVDPASGLVYSPAHFTWMDTNYPAATPRQGYPLEIQALWIAALNFLSELEPGQQKWKKLADQARHSVRELFIKPNLGWLVDCLHARPGTPAGQAQPDNALRCNQLLAVTLGAITNPAEQGKIIESSQELLVPGAIRSLADRSIEPPLPVEWQGRLVNQPENPYRGHYLGDEDTSRKPAYHNGTAWTWLFPSYCEALVMVHGQPAVTTALTLLSHGGKYLLEQGCIGQLPEIVDGDYPHQPRGCGAQAWSAGEYLRVLIRLNPDHP